MTNDGKSSTDSDHASETMTRRRFMSAAVLSGAALTSFGAALTFSEGSVCRGAECDSGDEGTNRT